MSATWPGGAARTADNRQVAVLPIDRQPTLLELYAEGQETVAWRADPTTDLAIRRAKFLDAWLRLTPEEAEHGPERVQMNLEQAANELAEVQVALKAPVDGSVTHLDLSGYRNG